MTTSSDTTLPEQLIVDVVLPCLDEAEALRWVLPRMPAGFRAIVVDNGSTDGSAYVAQELGALVVRAPIKGFGSACHAGLEAATADLVAFMDADASMDPEELPRLLTEIRAGADLVLGRRKPTTAKAWPLHARIANIALSHMVRKKTGYHIHDLGPMRMAWREPLLALRLEDRRSGYPLEMVTKAAQSSWKLVEIPIPYYPREGRSKVTGTVRGTLTAIFDMRKVLNT